MADYYKNKYGVVVDQSGNIVTDRAKLQEASGNAQTSEARKQAFSQLQEQPITDNEGAVSADSLRSGGAQSMPPPTSLPKQEEYQVGLNDSVESARTNLDTVLKTERDAALKRQNELNSKLEKMMKESNPENRDTYEQEQRIIENQLDAAETASATLEEDFNKRRQVVSELDRLLTQGNQLIAQARNQPVAMSVLNKGVTSAAQTVQARAGVLQATLSGLDGNINAAHSIINNASDAVAAVWRDELAYNSAYMSLVEAGQLAKNEIHDEYAQSQITLAENKLSQLEATKTYLQGLMIDPATAQTIADAGITLNDSVEEINTKLAIQGDKQEREDTINELTLDGYKYLGTSETVFNRPDAVELEIGGKTLLFVPPPKEKKAVSNPKGTVISGALTYTPTDKADDASALEQARGDDGWTNSALYKELYDAWIANGGVLDDFLKEFPPKLYVNPDDDSVPVFLRNTSTKTGGDDFDDF